jgi:hypothetical protein
MLRTTALLGGMLMAIDYWTDPTRARVLMLTLVLVSFGMVLFFFQQKIADGSTVLRSVDGQYPLAFATYRYHGNGAAYLNLCWPFSAAIALFAVIRQTPAWPIWFLPLAATFIANFLNVSKAGNVLAALGIVLILALCAPFAAREIKRRRKIRPSRIVAAALPLLIVALALPFALPWKRWDTFSQSIEAPGSRPDVYEKFIQMASDAGAAGFGPGTFGQYSSRYLKDDPLLKGIYYASAHEDYLQTVIEWGYVGTLLWALLLVPAVILLLKGVVRHSKRRHREFEGYRIGLTDHVAAFFNSTPLPWEACVAAAGATAAILTALHALVDFPMQIASLQFYFLTVIALGWSYRLIEPEPEHQEFNDRF